MKNSSPVVPTKLSKDYLKRTIWIGLAFFGILLVWQLYNTYCSPMLAFLFVKHDYAEIYQAGAELAKQISLETGKTVAADTKFLLTTKNPATGLYFLEQSDYLDVQWKVGIIMALDNIFALFLMPLFGNWSDKTHSKLGKRMPYIIVGSVVTAIALPFIPFFFVNGMAEGTIDSSITGMIVGMVATMIIVIVFMMSYRSPAVALMPDLTPKPLRSKANGVINIVGYVGGAVGSVFGIVIATSKYIDGSSKSLMMLEIPFIVCSLFLILSLVLLLLKVKENKLHAELDETIKAADALGESAEAVVDNGKLSSTNKRNLALILIAEVFWFMSINAVETFQTNYVMFWLNCSSSGGAIMTVISGAASVLGFVLAGQIADKIGRKWTIFSGICLVTICYIIYSCIPQVEVSDFSSSLHWAFYILLPCIGLGTSLIHICSFPLVTDYCTSDKLGKFTSLYYTASMLAQSITPICLGFLFRATSWNVMPIYSAILMGVAGIVFFFVKAPRRNDKAANIKGLDALGADD